VAKDLAWHPCPPEIQPYGQSRDGETRGDDHKMGDFAEIGDLALKLKVSIPKKKGGRGAENTLLRLGCYQRG